MKQSAIYKISGMNRDFADSAATKQQAFEIRNMRLHHSDSNTFTALVNELGTLKARDANNNIVDISGTVIGFTTINETGILFTHEEDGVTYKHASDISSEMHEYDTGNDGMLSAPVLRAISSAQNVISDFCTYSGSIGGSSFHGNRYTNISFSYNNSTGQPVTMTLQITVVFFRITDGSDNPPEYHSASVYCHNNSANPSADFIKLINDSAVVDDIHYDDLLDSDSSQKTFTIQLNIPEASSFTGKILNGSVLIEPVFTGETAAQLTVNPAEITFSVHVLPVDIYNGAEDGITDDPFNNKPITEVICDYAEELSKKACDHIYLVNVTKQEHPRNTGNDVAVSVVEYFRGDLGFDVEHPIECTTYFENDEVQKVYWVDGKNPLRYANIQNCSDDGYWTNNLMFDSVPMLHLQEEVVITRNSTGGVFPSGTVQYAFTYLNRYGAESNIAWISPIYYSCPDDRGGAPDEICANSFTVSIRKYESDGRFNYIRLYHILRTSPDSEAEVRRVADIALPEKWDDVIHFTDTNTEGEAMDPQELLYLGGVSVIPNTIEQKSNTLFLGDLKNNYTYLRDVNLDGKLNWGDNSVDSESPVTFFNDIESRVPADTFSGYYSHENQLKYSSWDITGFRRGEDYRFGFQAQDGTGRWSDVWWLGDYRNLEAYPIMNRTAGQLQNVNAKMEISADVVNTLRAAGYRKIRPVVVYPEPWERNIYTEGLLNPTVYNVMDRASNAPFAQSSWFLRPFSPIDMGTISGTGWAADKHGNIVHGGVGVSGDSTYINGYDESETLVPFPESRKYSSYLWAEGSWGELLSIGLESVQAKVTTGSSTATYVSDISNRGAWAEFRHNHPLGDSQQRNGEIQSMYTQRVIDEYNNSAYKNVAYHLVFPTITAQVGGIEDAVRDFTNSFSDYFYVDQSVFTMNSADVDFDTSMQSASYNGCQLRITGIVPISAFCSSYDIQTNTPPNKFYTPENNSLLIPQGFYASEFVGASMTDYFHGWKSFISAPVWHDELTYNSAASVPSGASGRYSNDAAVPIGFAVYPWQGRGSLNNDSVGVKTSYSDADKGDTANGDADSASRTGQNYISAELKTKTIANLHYSYSTHHVCSLTNTVPFTVQVSTFLDQQSVTLTKIQEPAHSGLGTLHYFGNVDKLITPVTISSTVVRDNDTYTYSSSNDHPFSRMRGYPKMVSYLTHFRKHYTSNVGHAAFMAPYSPLRVCNVLSFDVEPSTGFWGNIYSEYDLHFSYTLADGSDRAMTTIPIQYNSCNHLVVALDYLGYESDYYQPYFSWLTDNRSIEGIVSEGGTKEVSFWNQKANKYLRQPRPVLVSFSDSAISGVDDYDAHNYKGIKVDGQLTGYLYMGQLYRSVPVPNKFGGTSEEALEQNMWLPAGEAVYLPANLDNNEHITLVWRAGDIYYQRYDALRTYPRNEQDLNKVIDIASFMTETHINIDGRYDTNRGLRNNNYVRPTNFNKMNYAYTQSDNFFVYHTLNRDKVHLDTFKYSFTWSLTKTSGGLRDEWTRVTLANTYDCDGNKGELTRISRLDNLLVAFQSGGVSQIMFNENVQLQGSEGTPIELANSGKMQGLRYYTTEVGCQNKWSVAVAPSGIFFIDGRSKDLYCLGAEGIQNISVAGGMSSWFKSRRDLLTVWSPAHKNGCGFYSHWDMTTGELFLTAPDTCLCYDTTLGVFIGFFDYQGMGAMFSISDTVLTTHQDDAVVHQLQPSLQKTQRYDQIWLHRKNRKQHCFIFNQQRESYVEVVCNGNNDGSDYGLSKIFDNLSWRADAWSWVYNTESQEGTLIYEPFITFTKLSGSDDYQRFSKELNAVNKDGDTVLDHQTPYPVMPINLRKKFKVWYTTMPRALDDNNQETRDRIRDTWCHVRLTLGTTASEYRHVLHDIIINYFIP